MQHLRIGIIGFGRIGAEHAGWLAASESARATAVLDATPARQELARQRGLSVCENLGTLLDDPGIDAILVASPTAMHFEHASAALSAGKHVLVEKPMALDLPQAKRLRDIWRTRKNGS